MIGLFLNNAAQSGYQQVLVRQALQGEPVRRFMNADPIVVPDSLDLQHWVEDFVYRYYPGNKEGHIPTRSASEGPMKSSQNRRGSPLDD